MATSRLCSIPDCGKAHSARGWCRAHYQRWRRNGDPLAGRVPPGTNVVCSIDGCERAADIRNLCPRHYRRWWAHGDPLVRKKPANGEARRFLMDVVLPYRGDDCLTWPYYRDPSGYAKCGRMFVTKFVCEQENGPAPSPTHQSAHTCGRGNQGCVTPRHLVWKTPAGNQRDRVTHGTSNRGERSATAKLTREDVRTIRQMIAAGSTLKSIALRYGVHPTSILHIRSRKNWAWLD